MEPVFDAVVIGAGFGGLGAALTLAESGARVALCETLKYPGGCASTFSRDRYRFDAGATLLSGLGAEQPFGRWLARYAPEAQIEWMDPIVELRAPGLTLHARRDRGALLEQLCALDGAPREGLRSFFAKQRAVADALWKLFDDPSLLPPFDAGMLLRHASRALDYAKLLPLLGRPLSHVLSSHGLDGFAPLRLWADALCQITVQCRADEAEAPFALAAMDYYHRGTGHLLGGVGTMAEALTRGVTANGGEVQLATRVSGLKRAGDLWEVATRRGTLRTRSVVANVLPAALSKLAEAPLDALLSLDDAWGAVMLYAGAVPPSSASAHAHHLQLVGDARAPLVEGNHVFVSASSAAETERAPAGQRTLTVSTHVPLKKLREAREPSAVLQSIREAMLATLAARAPEWASALKHVLPASPRTWERFTGRPGGAVGGPPRRAGFRNYVQLGPREVLRNVWLVGDTVFPGQSALATALGGVQVARSIRA